MKKGLMILCLVVSCMLTSKETKAQIPVLEIIKQAVKKVIIAVDLKIQRLQNKTIWLQNAQKTLENEMSKLKLHEISDWVEKQRKLYDDYFQELWRVKAALSYYHRVREIISRQFQMVKEYKDASAIFSRDKNFTKEELESISNVYSGMMKESLKNIDQLFLVANALTTQMSDAKRLQIINAVSDNIEATLMDLKEFNEQNKMVSLQRAAEKGEIDYVKKLYGL
ncbi:MAG: conjugal transfer protein TraI [Chitinophagaceae bacterium]|nr:MAG: conjugal transfer protein TraI [Chitinophagaceae bacterium]